MRLSENVARVVAVNASIAFNSFDDGNIFRHGAGKPAGADHRDQPSGADHRDLI